MKEPQTHNSVKGLKTLRDQFAAGSSMFPGVRHTLTAMLDPADLGEDHGLYHRPGENDELWGYDFLLIEPAYIHDRSVAGPQATTLYDKDGNVVYHALPRIHVASTLKRRAGSGIDIHSRFAELAAAAWKFTLQLPNEVWRRLEAPKSILTLTNRVWLGWYRRYMSAEQVENGIKISDLDPSDAEVMRKQFADRYHMRGLMAKPDQLWLLAVHNLAWQSAPDSPLFVQRRAWKEHVSYSFSMDEGQLDRMFSEIGSPAITVPIARFRSELPTDPFLSSVWAIDILLQDLKNLTTSHRTIDWATALTVTDAAKLLMNDFPGLSLNNARARVSKAASSKDKFVTNEKKRTALRIDPHTFNSWRIDLRDKDLDEEHDQD